MNAWVSKFAFACFEGSLRVAEREGRTQITVSGGRKVTSQSVGLAFAGTIYVC